MKISKTNKEYYNFLNEINSFDPYKDDEVDEVSSDKNAPLTDKKGGKMIKRDNVIIPKESNNINVLANKRKKEHISATFDNFRKSRLTAERIRNHKVSWLIDKFIINQSLGMIYAQAGSSKSYFAVFLSLYLLKNNTINEIFYLDADNGLSTVKERNGDKWIDLANDKLVYLSSECIGDFNKKILPLSLLKV